MGALLQVAAMALPDLPWATPKVCCRTSRIHFAYRGGSLGNVMLKFRKESCLATPFAALAAMRPCTAWKLVFIEYGLCTCGHLTYSFHGGFAAALSGQCWSREAP